MKHKDGLTWALSKDFLKSMVLIGRIAIRNGLYVH